ncbi:MAG: BON domain-containing protein [Acidobacteriota bacterium]
MRNKVAVSRLLIAVCCAGMAGMGTVALATPSTFVFAADNGSSDAALASAVKDRLRGKNYKDVTVRTADGTVTLSGQVTLFAYKAQAVKKAKKTKGVKDVRDNIAVGGPTIPDDVLQKNLLRKIEVDRVGYGQVFDAISVSVQNGVVLLGGHAIGPVTKQSAVALAQYTPGVKEVIDRISVDPVSPFDDDIRVRTYRAIYGYPSLQRYAIVPWKPIRISVQNGRVTLYGIVDNEMDKQLAYTRALQVPNVFQVTNDLVVSNEKSEKSKKK